MFFGNKKNEMGEADTLKKEVVAQKEKEEIFVISDYAMERYKKNTNYHNDNLSNEEIELLFSDKTEYGLINYEKFSQTLLKLSYYTDISYQWIVFPPNFQYNHKERNQFKNCIFYEVDFESDNLYFYNCEFRRYDTSTYHVTYMNVKNDINCVDIKSDIGFSILNASFIGIHNSHLRYLRLKEFENKKIDEIFINKSTFIYGMSLDNNIDELNIKESQILQSKDSVFQIYSQKINKIYMNKFDLSLLEAYQVSINKPVINIDIYNSTLPDFFNLNEETEVCSIHSSNIDYYKILDGVNNSNLSLTISDCETTQKPDKYNRKSLCKELSLSNLKIDKSLLIDIKIFNSFNCQIDNLDFFDSISEIYLYQTNVYSDFSLQYIEPKKCFLNNCIISKIDLKFASINKLAIYKSNFKELDFDCSFINEARFVQVKGLNEENETEELSEKHFASKDSFKFFEKVTKE